ncbi:olfactory receptor 13C9-like [Mantella aurantiaca]
MFDMSPGNQTFLKEFILVGFPHNMQICILFFAALFFIYMVIILGNIFIIYVVCISPKLHTPMYFFLCNLSFLDLCFSSNSVPKMLLDALSKRRTISVLTCMVQMNIGLYLGATEGLLLAVMAYDRYIAICFPFYYVLIMNLNICRNIAVAMWLGGFCISVGPTISIPLIFCTENKLDHFVCEVLAVVNIACGNITIYKQRLFIAGLIALLTPFAVIVMSYCLIISSILTNQRTEGRSKAFSTCASHLTVVSMFYGTTIAMYMGQAKYLSSILKYIALIYGVITPVLNPLIYSLRNKEIKKAFMKILIKVSSVVKMKV